MAQNITDVDQFDATIQWPSAGETISANDTRDKAIQKLSNRTRYNKINSIANTSAVRAAASSWYAAETLGIGVHAMIFDGTYWAALGLGNANSYCDYTLDGVTWTAGTIAGIGTTVGSVDADAGGGVMLAAWDPAASTATRLYRSTDGGATWATADLPVAYDGDTRVVWTGTNFLAIQEDGAVYSSATGATSSWSAAASLPAGYTVDHFTFRDIEDGVVVGVEDNLDTKVISTTDEGATWHTTDITGVSSPRCAGVAYSSALEKWVIVGTDNGAPACWTATDPSGTWTQLTVTVYSTSSTSSTLDELRSVGGTLVAMRGTEVVTSRDGETWYGGLRNFGADSLRSGGGRLMHFESTSYYMTPSVNW